MAVEIELGGYSDDVHTISVNGEPRTEEYREFVVHLGVAPGLIVRATMEYRHPSWVCRITAPEGTVVSVNEKKHPLDPDYDS